MVDKAAESEGSTHESNRTRISYHEVLSAAVRRDLAQYRGRAVAVECYDPEVAIFRDAIDFCLPLYGNRGWIWVDEGGREHRPVSWLGAGVHLTRELAWRAPVSYLRHKAEVRRLEQRLMQPVAEKPLERAIFIRSDHVFGVTSGGSVGHLSGVIRGLRNEGVDLQVVSSDWLVDVPRDEQFHLLNPDYGYIRNVPELPRLVYNRQLMDFLGGQWDAWRPDFVYHRYSMHSYIGPLLRDRFDVPYVCEYNGSFVWMNRYWGKRPMYFEGLGERIEMLNLKAADLVVVVSQAMADEVVARGIAREKVLVNPNGVNPDRYRPDVDGDEVRRRYGLEEKLVVGFIGTFGPWHGAEKLAEAVARIQALDSEALRRLHFLLIGDGERMALVREVIDQHGLHDHFTLTGRVPQEQGPAHLAACDILASPHVPNPDETPFFGSPTKLFEYMAMGRAIVASDLDQIGEVLDHGETGWLVPPGDAEALARAILVLMRDPEMRARLGHNARRVAEAQHTWDAHTRRILDALRMRLRDGRVHLTSA